MAHQLQKVPVMPEDRVFYRMFASSADDIDKLHAACEALLEELTEGYIWHNEGVALAVVPLASLSSPDDAELGFASELVHAQALAGSTDFGENIEDEWFLLQCLVKITEKLPLVLQVYDADGQFVLIEASSVIPRWLSPETAGNRVFFKDGACHIIPQPCSPDMVGVVPIGACALLQAVALLVAGRIQTLASPQVQECLIKRMQRSADRKESSSAIHKCRVLLPKAAAAMLSARPQLSSHAVAALAYRDPKETAAMTKLNHFDPSTLTSCTVKMTRFCYAQLQYQSFKPPARYGRIPPSHHVDYRASVTGCRLLCGLELLACRGDRLLAHGVVSAVKSSSGFKAFVTRLRQRGMFDDVVEGSKRDNELMDMALTSFLNQMQATQDDQIKDLKLSGLEKAAVYVHEMLQQPDQEAELDLTGADDDDAWLDVSMDDIDSKLETYKQQLEASITSTDKAHSSSILDKLKQFVDTTSSADGAEMQSDRSKSAHDESDDEDEYADGLMADGDDVDIEGEDFVSALQALLSGTRANAEQEEMEERDEEQVQGMEGTFAELWKQMDKQLQTSTMASSFEKDTKVHLSSKNDPNDEDSDDEAPVDVDMNLVKNMLESFKAQGGASGPTSLLLNS